MRFSIIIICSSLFVSFSGIAQRIDHTASFRNVSNEDYFRFHYDNDFFSANDYYYSQGYSFELCHSGLKRNPVNKTLLKLKDSGVVHGLAFEHFGFTPTSIRSDDILTNDRPFAACLLLKSYQVSTNQKKRLRLSSLLSAGVIGPLAFGGEMQESIHRWIGGIKPRGWQHQIRNGIILNYELNLEKEAYTSKYFSVNYNGNLRVGTLNTKTQTGLAIIAGQHRDVFSLQSKKKKHQFYVYSQPLVSLVAHDATLQGDFFTASPHTIKSSALKRINFQNNFGAIVQLNNVYLEYNQTLLTKEFDHGKSHRWGGFKIGFLL